jgi:hypothetical protein
MQSFVYSVKRIGKLTQSWGASVLMVRASESVELILTCTLLVRKESYHLNVKGFTFICFSFSHRKCT